MVAVDRENYLKLTPTPNEECNGWGLRAILNTYESFYTLVSFCEKRRMGLSKCNYPGIRQYRSCRHSLLLSMAANKTCRIATKYILQQMEDQKKRRRRAIPENDQC